MAKNLIEQFISAIKPTNEAKNDTRSATVSRIDNEGRAWVYVAGAEKETPTASTSAEVKRGDKVDVSWRNNKLYIEGNYSNPSAGVERVTKAENKAEKATTDAERAVADAERAKVAAESAEADATRASNAATSAQHSASNAGISASQAQAASEAAQAAALASITTDTIHYLATSLASGVTKNTSGWTTSIQTMTSTNKYLWTYHTYTTAGGASTDSTPVITGTYGEKGADGTSVTILGSYNTLAELQQAHPTGPRGDSYMVSGDLYVWNGSAWENVGQIQGPQGATGPQGASVAVSSIAYAVTTTDSEPQAYPYSTVPTVPEGSWLWTKTTYSDGTSAITKAKQGVSGTNGTDGADGTDGVSVTAVQPQYYLSQSDSSATGGSWSTTLSYVIGKFIWTRDYITYSNGTHGTSTAIYNEALTQSCYNAATALGLVQEQQEYFWHDALGAHVLSDKDTVTGTRYRTDIKGAGMEIFELDGQSDTSVAKFGSDIRVGASNDKNVSIDSNGIAINDGQNELANFDSNSMKIGGSWDTNFLLSAGTENNRVYGQILLGAVAGFYPYLRFYLDGVVHLSTGGVGGTAGSMDMTKQNVTFTKPVYVEGHSSPIGTIVNGTEVSNKNLANETAKRLASISLPAGVWVVTGFVRFPSNANGVRRINISTTDNSNSIDIQISASSNNTMQLEAVKILQPSSTTTYYLNAWQNSNTSLTASDVTFRAVRIA